MITLNNWIAADQRNFRVKKDRIRHALKDGDTGIISGVTDSHKADIFYMLCFCLCVPQSKAIKADEAIDILKKKKFFEKGLTVARVVEVLHRRVRFHHNKAKRLIEARDQFDSLWEYLTKTYSWYLTLETDDEKNDFLKDVRLYLDKNIKGMGLKLASQFLRNIGMGDHLSILDVHVLTCMQKRELIPEKFLTQDNKGNTKPDLTKNNYYDIEDIMKQYADEVGITLDELDLLFWSERTGFVFK